MSGQAETMQQSPRQCGAMTPTSRRWADIAISASEDEDDGNARASSPPPPPTADIDDSYQGLPVPAMEDSREGLNKELNIAANLQSTAPSDFSFLLQNAAKVATETCEEALALTPSRKWKPNADAPEFIPTLTQNLVVCEEFSTPQKCVSESRRRDAASRKRLPSWLLESTEKRTKSEERERADASRASQNQMPEATEEEWQHRIYMRQQAIDIGKKTPEYAIVKSRPSPDGDEPRTPDPRDRTKSKRRWKYDVNIWRSELAEKRCHLLAASLAPQ